MTNKNLEYDIEKIKSAVGEKIKVKATNKYREATLLGIGYRRSDRALMIKARIAPYLLPWGTHVREIDYYPMNLVRKADKNKWQK